VKPEKQVKREIEKREEVEEVEEVAEVEIHFYSLHFEFYQPKADLTLGDILTCFLWIIPIKDWTKITKQISNLC